MEKFTTTIPGYKKSEVNKFLNDVILEVDSMINKMKSKDLEIEKLKAELDHYKNLESTFNRAILVAEEASTQIKKVARDESEAIITEAKINANRIINDALRAREKAENDTERLRRNIITFKRRLKTIVENQLDVIEDLEHIDL